MAVELSILMSNIALIIVTLTASAVEWHKDNALARIVKTLRPSWCRKCKTVHQHKHKKGKKT